jgi:DNA (cytosine-5)-methyltransferase 1
LWHGQNEVSRKANSKRYQNFCKVFYHFLSYYKPIFFVVENVNTLKNNAIFSTLTRELEEGLPAHRHDYPGYDVKYQILLASDYGVPQLRKRLFIVGRRKDTNLSFEFPKKNTSTQFQ